MAKRTPGKRRYLRRVANAWAAPFIVWYHETMALMSEGEEAQGHIAQAMSWRAQVRR